MKKVLLFICLLLIPINIFAISASSYVLMDQNTGNVLKSYNENDKSLIASITKIMTAIIVIENSDLEKEVKVTDEVLKAYGSAIYIEVGEKITIEELLYGLMLRSGNDAAIVLAEAVSGSMDEFVKLMNNKVKELELDNTVFVNNHGLEESDGENYSSAYDMGIITKYAMENSVFRKISNTEKIVVETNYKTYSWTNKNKLLGSYDYITGGKTGYTEKAGRTLVTTASRDNMNLIVVTINDGNDWNDHISLYEYAFDNYESVKMIDKELTSIKEEDKIYYVENDYFALVENKDVDNLNIEYLLYEEKISNRVGKVVVYLNNEVIHEEDLFEKDEEKNFVLSIWDKIVGWFKSW